MKIPRVSDTGRLQIGTDCDRIETYDGVEDVTLHIAVWKHKPKLETHIPGHLKLIVREVSDLYLLTPLGECEISPFRHAVTLDTRDGEYDLLYGNERLLIARPKQDEEDSNQTLMEWLEELTEGVQVDNTPAWWHTTPRDLMPSEEQYTIGDFPPFDNSTISVSSDAYLFDSDGEWIRVKLDGMD